MTTEPEQHYYIQEMFSTYVCVDVCGSREEEGK